MSLTAFVTENATKNIEKEILITIQKHYNTIEYCTLWHSRDLLNKKISTIITLTVK